MLVDCLVESARSRGNVLAVADHATTLTYRRLRALARVMRDEVMRRTDAPRVGLMLPASAAFAGSFFGTLWASRTAVPLNFLLAADELLTIVETAGLDTILTVRHFADLAAKLPATAVFMEDLPLKRRVLLATWLPAPSVPTPDPNDTAVLLFTSGTSAEPKGVELTYRNLRSNCDDCIATADMKPDHRFLNCLPPFHVFGLTANVLAPVVLGASVYCIPRFQPSAVIRALKEHEISIFMAIPSMHAAILRSKSATSDLMKSVYLAVSGGEPLPDELAKGYRERFGIDLLQGYGLTETSPVCAIELPTAHRAGSIGRPIRNLELRIASNAGEELPTGTDGEIRVRGPNVMKGYFKRPAETRAVLTEDGWFRTGDAGHVDEDGFVFITGRLKEMMIVGGENVYPREIEAVLEQHPAVAEAAVIGAPDASRGEVPVAFVTCKEGAEVTEVELRAFVRERLAGYKTPRSIRIATDLPRTPIGKILKRKLADLL